MVRATAKKPIGLAGDIIAWIVDYSIDDDEIDRVKIIVLPTLATLLCFHYRDGMRTEIGGAVGGQHALLVGMHATVRTCWPSGPFGSVSVHLRPEAVEHVTGGQVPDLRTAISIYLVGAHARGRLTGVPKVHEGRSQVP
jgi:hypothetical protein